MFRRSGHRFADKNMREKKHNKPCGDRCTANEGDVP
jgi:hypothetical protein